MGWGGMAFDDDDDDDDDFLHFHFDLMVWAIYLTHLPGLIISPT